MAKLKYKYRVKNKHTGDYLSNGKGTTTWSSIKWAVDRITSQTWANRKPEDYVLEKIEMVVVETIEVNDILREKAQKVIDEKVRKEKIELEKTRVRTHIQELCNCTVDQARTMIKSGIVVEPIQSRLKVLIKQYDRPKING